VLAHEDQTVLSIPVRGATATTNLDNRLWKKDIKGIYIYDLLIEQEVCSQQKAADEREDEYH